MYFDTLDDNGLDHVAKYIRSKRWPSFTRVADVFPLLGVLGDMGSFLRNLFFHTLHIGYEPDSLVPVKKGEIWTSSIRAALRFIKHTGKYVHTIHVQLG